MSEKIESSDKKPWRDKIENALGGTCAALYQIGSTELGRICTGPGSITNQPGTPDLMQGLAKLRASTKSLNTVSEIGEGILEKLRSGMPLEKWELGYIDELRELGQSYTQEEKGPES